MRFVIPLVIALGLGAAPPSVASAEPPPAREVVYTRPSGFWTSTQPAKHGAYRWRLLGVGVVFLVGTGAVMLVLLRRAKRDRTAATLGRAPGGPRG